MQASKLKIYTERLPENLRQPIIAHFGHGNRFMSARTDILYDIESFLRKNSDSFIETTAENADFALLPFDWHETEYDPRFKKYADTFVSKSAVAKLPLLVFWGGDSEAPAPFKNAILIRNVVRHITPSTYEFTAPAMVEDFVAEYMGGNLNLREYHSTPSVSFCGFALPLHPIKKATLRIFKPAANIVHKKTYGPGLRSVAIDILRANKAIRTDFIVRDKYYDGIWEANTFDQAGAERSKEEYINNLISNDYVLCVRGMGNWSVRLFEAMSCGRIPVFVDTDISLPYEKYMDYRSLFVWVDWKDFWRIDEAILAFHRALSQSEFESLQQRCRKTWEEWLSPKGFFSNIRRYIEPCRERIQRHKPERAL